MKAACAEASLAAAPARNNACKRHAPRPRRRQPCSHHWMQTACADASKGATPDSNNPCKRHTVRSRRQQLLPSTPDANGMRRCLENGSSCQQQCMPAACAGASPAAAPASNTKCQRHAMVLRNRPLPLPTTMDANGMRRSRATGSSCRQQCMQAACAEASPEAAPTNNNGCKRPTLVPLRRQLLPATMHATGMC